MRLKQRIIRDVIYYSFLMFLFFVRLIPYKILSDFGGRLSKFIFRFLKDDQKVIHQNLEIAFQDKTQEEIAEIQKGFYEHIGRAFVEFLKAPYLSETKFKELFVQVNGIEHIKQAFSKNKGVIFLTSHIGNWEIMGAYVATVGFPLNVVATKIYDERLNKILLKHRKSRGVNTLMREESTKEMVRVLKEKECLGILIDQDTDVKGVFVDFFGKEANTPIGATVLAHKYDVVVLPAFTNRVGKYKHIIDIDKPVKLSGDIKKDTQKFNNIIEARIKKYPSQWVWLHQRWKRKQKFKK